MNATRDVFCAVAKSTAPQNSSGCDNNFSNIPIIQNVEFQSGDLQHPYSIVHVNSSTIHPLLDPAVVCHDHTNWKNS